MVGAHVVRDFQIGNTHIRIADNFCKARTPGEIGQIMGCISEQAQKHFTEAAAAGRYGQKENADVSANHD